MEYNIDNEWTDVPSIVVTVNMYLHSIVLLQFAHLTAFQLLWTQVIELGHLCCFACVSVTSSESSEKVLLLLHTRREYCI